MVAVAAAAVSATGCRTPLRQPPAVAANGKADSHRPPGSSAPDFATTPTEGADEPPRVTCVRHWVGNEEPALARSGDHFVGPEGVCRVVQITFESVRWYEAMSANRLPVVRARLLEGDPSVQVTVVVGREPTAIYRNREQLERNDEIPPGVVPEGFDFTTHALVQTEYGHSGITDCRDRYLGMTGQQAKGHREARETWYAQARALASKWRHLSSPPAKRIKGVQVVVIDGPSPGAPAEQGMCTTQFVWQPALVAVDASGAPLRLARP